MIQHTISLSVLISNTTNENRDAYSCDDLCLPKRVMVT